MPKKVLVANRGEIALRILRACREEGIETVAVHSDADSESLHVKLADESVCIGPAKALDSYLNFHAILSAAEITQADAIHPGYGFLAESAEFADTCRESGIKFIGPSSESIRLMGDKIRARKAMEKAGLPVLPGDVVDIGSPKRVMKLVEKVGFPLIVKAAHGGGGRGMKIVENESDVLNQLRTAHAESEAAFGKATIYIEKYLPSSRHVEFQIAADDYGNVICLGERDCTVQRRFQKLIEESPCPVMKPKLRQEMVDMLRKSLNKISYTNVGTVEFLMDTDDNLYFLEMNTRIQVEHPVTEMVTGLDLIKLQIRLSDGEKLSIAQEDVKLEGHSIECRINAEDPIKFRPSIGSISGYHAPGGKGIRVDSTLYGGYTVLPHYDSLLAKVIVHGTDRAEAIRKMKVAIDEMVIDGIDTNIDFHRRVLEHPDFCKGDIDTQFTKVLQEK